MTNNFVEGLSDTDERTRSEKRLDNMRQQGGVFVEAVRLTRMPMIVTDATLPGNPIIFANEAFVSLSGYALEEITGQDPHFMDGPDTDADAVSKYQAEMVAGRMQMSSSSSIVKAASRSGPCSSQAHSTTGKAECSITSSPTWMSPGGMRPSSLSGVRRAGWRRRSGRGRAS
jgi:hypothetical protein